MKKRISHPILAAFVGLCLATGVVHGGYKEKEKETPEKPQNQIPKEAIEAIEKSGISPEVIKELKEAMKAGDGASVSVHTTVVGPDGKVITRTTQDGSSMDDSGDGKNATTLDLEKLISDAISEATAGTQSTSSSGKSSGSSTKTITSTSISRKVVIVGKDGEVETHTIGEGAGNDALEKALGEALSSIDIKMLNPGDLNNQAQVFGFGPAMIEGSDVSDRLDEIEKELKEQRKLLESILKKL